jgi:ABC-type Na+ efflux pump permease subunit
MKTIKIITALVAIAIFMSTGAFAVQRSQGGRTAGVGVGSSTTPPASSNADHRDTNHSAPVTTGKSADHKSDLAGPKDPMGFKNYGQYTAAQHVSENLNIPFADLKALMVDGHKSLGESIHQLRPDLTENQVQVEVKKAEAAAKKADADTKKKS